MYAPELFDPDRYNWEDYSDFVFRYAPHLIDYRRMNWKKIYEIDNLSLDASY